MQHPVHADVPAVWVRRAWWSLVLFLPSFVAAFVVGEGLASAFGYPAGAEGVPAWVALTAGSSACVVFAAPVLVVWAFARRAHGVAGSRTPVIVAGGVAGIFLAQNLLSGLAMWVSSW